MPGSSSMNAPKGWRRATLPVCFEPGEYFSATFIHGSSIAALRESQSFPFSSTRRTFTLQGSLTLKTSFG